MSSREQMESEISQTAELAETETRELSKFAAADVVARLAEKELGIAESAADNQQQVMKLRAEFLEAGMGRIQQKLVQMLDLVEKGAKGVQITRGDPSYDPKRHIQEAARQARQSSAFIARTMGKVLDLSHKYADLATKLAAAPAPRPINITVEKAEQHIHSQPVTDAFAKFVDAADE